MRSRRPALRSVEDLAVKARWQLLGNGRRAYNPLLMRFHSPDLMSPFGRGGINAYAYCGGDPVNRNDPSGRSFLWVAMGAGVAALAAGAPAFHLADEHDKPRVALTVALGLAVAALAVLPASVMAAPRRMKSIATAPSVPVGAEVPARPLLRRTADLTGGRFQSHARRPSTFQGEVPGPVTSRRMSFDEVNASTPGQGKTVRFVKTPQVHHFEIGSPPNKGVRRARRRPKPDKYFYWSPPN